MKRKEFQAFWLGLIAAAVLSYYLYRFLQPRREISPRPLVVGDAAVSLKKTESAKSSRKDPLTAIRGIGPATEQKLYEVGIHSYSDLASSSPSELLRFTGSRWDPKDWIEEARELASQQ